MHDYRQKYTQVKRTQTGLKIYLLASQWHSTEWYTIIPH